MNNLKEALGILLKEQYAPYLVSSLYLRLAPEDRTDRKYLRVFKNMVKAQRENLELRGLERDVLNSVVEDFERMEEFLSETENLKNCGGIALFSCSAKKIFVPIKLPYTYRNRLMVSPNPLVREIAAIDEELGTIGVLLIDRKHVRFFLMDFEGIGEISDFLEPLATRAHKFHSGGASLKGAQGTFKYSMPSRASAPNMVQHAMGEYRFHMRIQEEKHRLFKIANDALMEAWKENKFNKLVIGSIREDIREIEDHLHPYLLNMLVGYVKLNPSEVTEHTIRDAVLNLLWQKDREQEEELVNTLLDLEGKGLAVEGLSKVLEQLYMGNVKTLLVAENFERSGYFCPVSNIPVLEPKCPTEEEPYPVEDIVDEVIELALEERAVVEVIVREDLQKKFDGVGALLRWKI
ncbi:peptide chain release factor 1 [Thermocrinis sp.]|jgi:peptide chain release factor subunit 1|uniref:baeRF12 domain-containing protein n=1 Tax=Thermocrinis sp. TaxID=2024383 RepID=UPI003C0A9BC0